MRKGSVSHAPVVVHNNLNNCLVHSNRKHSSMAEIIGNAVNCVISLVDVDGVVRKVDVDDAIQRIDMNELLDKVDMNRLIDRVDLNRQLERVDLDRLMRRVDVNAIILRSDVGAIMAHSTTGIFTDILDTVRASVVQADMFIYNTVGFVLRRDLSLLPPVPGETTRRKKPQSEISLATSAQGCFSGVVSKGLAFLLDSLIVTFSFAILLIVVEMGLQVLTDADDRPQFNRDSRYALVAYCAYWFVYFWFWTVAAHKTIGMALVGLKVVHANTGSNISITHGFIRTSILPLSATVAMFLVALGLVRQDGRMLHDVVAGTGLTYKWNAAMAKFRAYAEQQRQTVEDDQRRLDSPLLQGDSTTAYSSLDEHRRIT